MRLASLLSMLLLALSIPIAAQNCHIFDLTGTVVQVNPQNCQFFVSLDFQHNGTSNEFSVSGNGNNYGTFSYGQVPLVLGPFNGNPNLPTVLEFVVQDNVFQDCKDIVIVDAPPCSSSSLCNITDLHVNTGPCDSLGLTYSLTLGFNVSGNVSNFFEVFTTAGVSLGIFPISALPLTIPAFPASGNPIDVVKVCITDQPDCCAALEFQAPSCTHGFCFIDGLTVQTGDCTGDSTYTAKINFHVIGQVATDSFTVYANGHATGTYSLAQLPLTTSVHWDGGLKDVIKVCLSDGLATCCKEIEYAVPNCLSIAPCGIYDLVVKPDTCTSDSTYSAVLNFAVNDPTAVDSFDLWADAQYIGHFGMNQLPLHLDLPWNGLIFNHVKVCTGNLPACCKEYQFLAPACLPFKPCEITNIFLQTGACTSDSTYKILLNFNATNPGNGTFTVSIHNQLIDTFNLTQAPLMLEVPWNGQTGDFISICILGSTVAPGTVGCCKIKQFNVPACLLPCDIFDVVVDPGACNPNSNTYSLGLNFHVTNPGNDFFEVWGNGTYLGTFPLAGLPMVIPNFPANGNAGDVIKICINDHPNCCQTLEFQGPNCGTPACEIYDLSVDPGDCNPATGNYFLTLNFGVHNPGNDFFEVWGNGTYLGIFPLSSLPLTIPNFPSNGNAGDVIKVCINDHPDCCQTLEFQGPNCNTPVCEIYDLAVDPGDCDPATGNYSLTVNFGVHNPGNDFFEVWGNGTYLGIYPLSSLPLTIPNFPSNGNAGDVIKVCINDHPDCCQTLEFQGPNCNQPCEIYNLTVVTGDCNPADSTYQIKVDFQVQNPGSNTFSVWANGVFFGSYDLSQLPLHIPNFPWDGAGPNDVIKVCMTNNSGSLSCCRTLEFATPDCFNNTCHINDLSVNTGDCTGDSAYAVTVNFQAVNPPGNVFGLWANGLFQGFFNLSQLPLHLTNIPWNGGLHDIIEVCFTNSPTGQGACCTEIEYTVPACLLPDPCQIFDLVAFAGICNPNSNSYPLTVDFGVINPVVANYSIWVNGTFYGSHPLSQLPLVIQDVPSNGNGIGVVKVCINDHPDCCASLEYDSPNCNAGGPCEIYNVVVDPGDCVPGSTLYHLNLNFQVQNPGNNFFEVWGNGIYLGSFPLASLPINLANFPSNGNAIDVIKICINDHPDCCKTIEFQGPTCGGTGNCEIYNLTAVPGDCTSDSSYVLHVNFQVQNPTGNTFQLWANGQLFGTYNLSQLPLTIQNFPWNGNPNNFIKVCMVPNDPNVPPCCREADFAAPGCLGNPCHIYDLVVLHTPCLCGQFFAVLNFKFSNVSNGGFDVLLNGNVVGTYPYNTPQPLILGPYPGDGTTMYQFAVVDHNHPDLCGDDFNLGKIECMTPVSDPGNSASLMLSPNPVSNWLNVSALLENGGSVGQARVNVYAADGRLAISNTVTNGNNFQLDVSALPAGMFRLVLISDAGRLEGTFAKQ